LDLVRLGTETLSRMRSAIAGTGLLNLFVPRDRPDGDIDPLRDRNIGGSL